MKTEDQLHYNVLNVKILSVLLKRIKKIQSGNCGEIFLVSFFETDQPFLMEKMLHTRYFGKKVLNEWFELSSEDVLNFKKTCSEIQENIDALQDNYFFQKKYGKN